jgi:hypothetical protein
MPYKITSIDKKIKLKDILYNIISNGNRIITEESAKAILNDYGIRVPPFVLVGNKEASNKINTKATDYLVSNYKEIFMFFPITFLSSKVGF